MDETIDDTLRGLGEEGRMETKTFIGKVRATTIDIEKHTVEVVMSDDSLDRYDEVVMASGWELKDYKKHPVLLSSHRYSGLLSQIGKALKIKVEDGELVAKLQYFVGDGNDEADWAWKLVEKGIAAFSVGFSPSTWVYRGDEDYDDMLEAWQAADPKRKKQNPRLFFTKQTLLENSQVLVPANPNGLMKGLEDKDLVVRSLAQQIKTAVDAGDFIDEDGDQIAAPFAMKDVSKGFEAIELLIQKAMKDGISDFAEGAKEPDGDGIHIKDLLIGKEYGSVTIEEDDKAVITSIKFCGADGDEVDEDIAAAILKELTSETPDKEAIRLGLLELEDDLAENTIKALHLEKDLNPPNGDDENSSVQDEIESKDDVEGAAIVLLTELKKIFDCPLSLSEDGKEVIFLEEDGDGAEIKTTISLSKHYSEFEPILREAPIPDHVLKTYIDEQFTGLADAMEKGFDIVKGIGDQVDIVADSLTALEQEEKGLHFKKEKKKDAVETILEAAKDMTSGVKKSEDDSNPA